MKKLFSLLCAMLIVFSASAAPQLSKHMNITEADMVAAKAAKSNPLMAKAHKLNHKPVVKKLATTKATVAEDATLAITVSDIAYNYAYVTVEPSDEAATYYWNVLDEETYEDILAGAYAQEGINDLCDYFQGEIDYLIQLYTMFGMEVTIDDLLTMGPDVYELENLEAETGYVVAAVYMDANGCTSDAFTYSFTTPAFEFSGVEVNFVAVEAESDDTYLAEYGALEVFAADASGNIFDMLFYVNEGFVGTYTEADLEGAGIYMPVGDDYEELEVLSATFTISATATPDEYVLVGDFVMANGDLYHITVTFEATAPEPVDYYEYDATAPATLVYDNTTAELAVDTEDYTTYGVVYYEILNAAQTDVLDLFLFSSSLTADGYCVDGVYTIDNSMAPGSCYASAGFDGESVYPSYYTTINAQGYILDIWFFVSGTVTVSNNGHNLVVNALNSKGQAVKYTYTEGGAQAIENNAAKANATKALVNGAIVIEKAGARFNLVGARL